MNISSSVQMLFGALVITTFECDLNVQSNEMKYTEKENEKHLFIVCLFVHPKFSKLNTPNDPIGLSLIVDIEQLQK